VLAATSYVPVGAYWGACVEGAGADEGPPGAAGPEGVLVGDEAAAVAGVVLLGGDVATLAAEGLGAPMELRSLASCWVACDRITKPQTESPTARTDRTSPEMLMAWWTILCAR